MTYYILLTLCLIILISYTFEVSGKFSKIPGVILLMLLGIAMRYLSIHFGLNIPDISVLLPIMGTMGLILIVLEGSLDLTITSDKRSLIVKSMASAITLFISFILIFAAILHIFYGYPFRTSIVNAIPFGIISSAVAIPSSVNLSKEDKEFVVYESSISDIVGILFFDFFIFNKFSLTRGVFTFSFEVIATTIFSIVFSAGLALMLNKIKHHVKYVIILTFVVLIFVLAKLVHWPSLIVVLIFGLIMNNNKIFQTKYFRDHIDFNELDINLKSFKQITGEFTFLVRSFFFLIFGFYTPVKDLLNINNIIIAIAIALSIFILRALFFRLVLRKNLNPLLYFAPRGLITILLFLSIPAEMKFGFVTEGLITQTIFITILIMAFGNLFTRSAVLKKE